MPSGVFFVQKILFRVIDRLGLAQDMDLDLTGIGKLGFDLLGDVAGEQDDLDLADLFGLDHDADLASRLNGIAARRSCRQPARYRR